MKNNIIVLLGKLRTNFRQSADNQINLISDLSHVEDSDVQIQPQTVNSGIGVPYRISTITTGSGKQVQIEVANEQGHFNIYNWFPIDTESGLDLDATVDGLHMSLGDVIQDVQKTEHFNSMVADISQMFMTTPNVDISTLDAYIEHTMTNVDETVSQLRNLILLNAPEGKLNQYTFLKLVQSIMNQGKNDLEHGSLKLNTNSPVFIANAIGTIILSILSTVAQVIGQVLAAVGTVLTVIASVLITLVSTIISNLSTVVRTQISAKSSEQLNIFDAPILACTDDFSYTSSGNTSHWIVKNSSTNEADVVSLGGLSLYVWAGGTDDEPRGWNVNGFLTLDLHPGRTLAWLTQLTDARLSGTYGPNSSVTLRLLSSSQQFPESVYYTTSEIVSLGGAGGDELTAAALFNFAMISWRNAKFDGTEAWFSVQNGWHHIDVTDLDVAYKYQSEGFLVAMQFIAAYLAGVSPTELTSNYGEGVGSNLTDLAIGMFASESKYPQLRSSSEMPHIHYAKTYTVSGLTREPLTFYKSSLHGLLGTPIAADQAYERGNLYVTDVTTSAIPTSGMFSFVNTKWEHLVAALVIAGVIAAAVCIAVAVGTVKYKQWSQRKSLQQWGDLQAARSRYIDPDTGAIIGGEAEYKAFRKQIKRYNRWGRILGYGTYDVTNNWNNAIEIPALSEVPTTNFGSEKILNDLTDDGEINLSSLRSDIVGESEDAPTLKDIKFYITGQ